MLRGLNDLILGNIHVQNVFMWNQHLNGGETVGGGSVTLIVSLLPLASPHLLALFSFEQKVSLKSWPHTLLKEYTHGKIL